MRISVNIISIVIVLLFFGCSQEVQKRVKINPEFAQYISAYTSGIVSRESSIKIMLSDEVAKAIVSEGQTIGDIIRFNPAIEGKAVFVSDRMIEFTPKNLLKSGTEYTAYFDLGKMTKMPQGLEEFNFQFKTIEQDLNIYIDGLSTYVSDNLKDQQLVQLRSNLVSSLMIYNLDTLFLLLLFYIFCMPFLVPF